MEIHFSVILRKVLTPNDFISLAEVEELLQNFERRYEKAPLPSNDGSPAGIWPSSLSASPRDTRTRYRLQLEHDEDT